MHRNVLSHCIAASLAATLIVAAPRAQAEPPPLTPLMERAFAKLEQGPDQLRWFAYRTQIIYNLSAADITAAYEARKTAEARTPDETKVATVDLPVKR